MVSFEERLTRFEKTNRMMFLLGCFFVFLVVGSWVVMAANMRGVEHWLFQQGSAERHVWEQLQQKVPSPSLREKALLDFCKIMIAMPLVIIKVLTVKFIGVFLFCFGLIMLSRARYERKLLALTREIMSLDKKEG